MTTPIKVKSETQIKTSGNVKPHVNKLSPRNIKLSSRPKRHVENRIRYSHNEPVFHLSPSPNSLTPQHMWNNLSATSTHPQYSVCERQNASRNARLIKQILATSAMIMNSPSVSPVSHSTTHTEEALEDFVRFMEVIASGQPISSL